ncbi:exodeoxyribonuclease III [Ravibacter arvi]|uniref:Exodeoxyribonuclease III n=1 Tax=Ravibacter arvi TaxID=2051041 RepID=A0ABP8M1V9_9BACT
MRILSYNVNGIRAALKNGLADWLKAAIFEGQPFDVLCFQEVKALQEQVDLAPLEQLGYQLVGWFAAEKKGYSGVATFARVSPDLMVQGFGVPFFDGEGRVLRTDFGELTLLNCYFPSGTSGEVRQTVKMQFLDDFYKFALELRTLRPKLIICGDYNIAHTPTDIHDPVGNKKSSGFLPEERAWMTGWFNSGFSDAFRTRHPDLVEYSWWTYRANARTNNKGWRIDYFSVSEALASKLINCRHFNDAIHSDHCPLGLALDI